MINAVVSERVNAPAGRVRALYQDPFLSFVIGLSLVSSGNGKQAMAMTTAIKGLLVFFTTAIFHDKLPAYWENLS